jgi:hypothetical protein
MRRIPFPSPPVTGLRINNDGHVCFAPGCTYACLQAGTMRNHTALHKVEQGIGYEATHQSGLHCSRLFTNGARRTYFYVRLDLGRTGASETYMKYEEAFFPPAAAGIPDQEALLWKEAREVAPWLRTLAWRTILDPFDRPFLRLLAAKPCEDDDFLFPHLTDAFGIWNHRASSMVSLLPADIRQRVATENRWALCSSCCRQI